MMRLGQNTSLQTGKTIRGRAVQQIAGGYVVKFGEGPNERGTLQTSESICLGKDILVQVVGYRGNQPLFHAVFSGF